MRMQRSKPVRAGTSRSRRAEVAAQPLDPQPAKSAAQPAAQSLSDPSVVAGQDAPGEPTTPPNEWHKRFGWVPAVRVEPIAVREGVVSLDGYGIRIAVRNGQLELADGLGQARRAGRFSKATCGIKRLVVRGHAFVITGEALAWLTDISASFVNLSYDGDLLAGWSPPGAHEPALRRAQAIAPWSDHGVELVRYLLEQKVIGQIANLERFFADQTDSLDTVRGHLERLRQADTPHALREAEAKAASAYWTAWSAVALRFPRRDERRVPDHWRTFGSRFSAVSNKPYQASNPANALLNYLYAILAAETRAACLTVGLDPDLGLFHTDNSRRPSLVYDVLEPVRPVVDAWLYYALRDRVWTWEDFAEVSAGVCRVLPPLTHALSETAPDWHKAIAPYVEHVAHVLKMMTPALALPSALAHIFRSSVQDAPATRFATPLTQRNRQRVTKQTAPATPKLAQACATCGLLLSDRTRRYCDDCLPAAEAERTRKFIAGSAEARTRIQALHAAGEGPQQRAEVREKKRQAMIAVRRAEHEWEQAHPLVTDADRTRYRDQIAPRLAVCTVAQIRHATGMSDGQAAPVRRGLVPHPRHWEALALLVGDPFSFSNAPAIEVRAVALDDASSV